jgi:hypothetical protein
MGTMQSTIIGVMEFKEQNGQTTVKWTDQGDSGNNLVKRWMSLLIGKMLGDEMDEGLKKLKAVTESKPKTEVKEPGNAIDEDAQEADEV